MEIEKPRISIVNDSVIIGVNYSLQNESETKTLWYGVDKSLKDYVCDEVSDGFLVGLLFVAMKNGEDIFISGAISEKLYYNLSNYVMHILNILNPLLKKVNIIPDQLIENNFEGKAIATGFSGGIDSFSVLADHYYNQDIPESYKINHLVFNNVADEEKISDKKNQCNYLYSFAKEKNIPLTFIDSNIYSSLDFSMEISHQVRNISAILGLQKLFGKYFYASGYPYEYEGVAKTEFFARADSFLLHLFSTESLEVISTGGQYTRTQKTKYLMGIPDTYKYLDVCTDFRRINNINCGRCFKCLRTLSTLEILGGINLYSNTFNLNNYEKYKKVYFAKLLSSKDQYSLEIKELARTKGYTFPIKSRILSIRILFFMYQSIRFLYFRSLSILKTKE